MKRNCLLNLALFSMVLLIAIGCGGSDGDVKGTQEKPVPGETLESAVENKGVAVAKEILDTYDRAVAEISSALQDKPAAAEAKVKLEAVYEKYTPLMAAMNKRYLALKSEDIALFGAANGYLGENRGRHVFKKDNDLGAFINHYSMTDKSDEVLNLLKEGLFRLLETAVKR